MATKSSKPQRLRVDRAKGTLSADYIEKCKALQERILKERNGELVPDSTEIIRAMRNGDIR